MPTIPLRPAKRKQPLDERLAAHISKPDGETGCHLWTGYRDAGGYGRLSVHGQPTRVHRLLLAHKLGRPIMPGYCALHHCDNPPCCNPAHLFEGTQRDNMIDRYRKARYNPHLPPTPALDGVLTLAQKWEIVHLWADPYHPPAYELAQQYGVPRSMIYALVGVDAA
jgi:hypothetical protein